METSSPRPNLVPPRPDTPANETQTRPPTPSLRRGDEQDEPPGTRSEQGSSAPDKKLRRHHLLTDKEHDRLREMQDGCCAICGEPDGGESRGLAVDHCHESGRVRGLLCTRCNVGLGMFRDDRELLAAAITYLEVSDDLYVDCCSKCGSHDRVAPYDWETPTPKGLIVAWYSCSHCHHVWSCHWNRKLHLRFASPRS